MFTSRFIEEADELLARLEPDDYAVYVRRYLAEGLRRFGPGWRYADIVTVLLGLAQILQPRTYLEIGVRRGRSACAVASKAPNCRIVGLDLWLQGYAGMENPGPDFVRAELRKVGHLGRLDLITGNSHDLLPGLFESADLPCVDLVTVDGDHSPEGAWQDLCDVLPRIAIGGAVVFDDIGHPAHPELRQVWQELVVENPRFSAWSFDALGYGVGFALRRC